MDMENIGADIGFLTGLPEAGIPISPTLEAAMEKGGAEVMLDCVEFRPDGK